MSVERISGEPPAYRATQLKPIPVHDPDGVLLADHPFGSYEPEYPEDRSQLEQVCWLAGKAELDFMCRIDVLADFDPRGGFSLRFHAAPGRTGESLMYAGEDAAHVATFLRGMAYYRNKGKLFLD